MQINDTHIKLIVNEINFAVSKMIESQDAIEKLFYFSGIFGVINRVYNIEFDSDLLFAHFVLRTTHEAFLNRVKAIQQGDRAVILNDDQFDKLNVLSKELSKKIEKNEDLFSTLKNFSNLMYSTTGNGYYLMKKGALKI